MILMLARTKEEVQDGKDSLKRHEERYAHGIQEKILRGGHN
jgi:hypothetical protein